jgi:hypothetical protein
MTDEPLPALLARLQALHEQATPAPLIVHCQQRKAYLLGPVEEDGENLVVAKMDLPYRRTDAEFIAALRNAWPRLHAALTQHEKPQPDAYGLVPSGPVGSGETGQLLSPPLGGGAPPVAEPPCGGCGGPHPFDTSVPSVLWNRVVRAAGLSDYLCLTCIVSAFAQAGEGFTAELWGASFNGLVVEFVIGGHVATSAAELNAENTWLRVHGEDAVWNAAIEGSGSTS